MLGRKQELKKLNQMYESNQFEFGVLYGRRRVGKNTFLNEFCRNKKVIYFVGVESTEKQNLENFTNNNYFYVFCKSGFTDRCLKQEKENEHVKLITFDDMNRKV